MTFSFRSLSLACATAFSLILGSLQADDAKTAAKASYAGEITGVVCADCKQHVQASLMKNLPGILSVNVLPGDKPDTQKITIVTAADKAVSTESANKALGEFANDYKILSLAKKD